MAGGALIPVWSRLKPDGGGALLKDVIAGTILSILLVPQAMAYAQLAGLPPETGLFAALLPPIIYWLYGSSAFVSLGPVALVSLIVGEAAANGVDPGVAVVIIAIEAGLLLVAIGALNLGRLVNFVSEPALLGFTAAAAVLIAFSQLPTLLGIDAERAGDLPSAAQALWAGLPETSWPTTIIGVAALVALLFFNKFAAPALWKIGLHPPWRQAVAKSLPLAVIVAAGIAAVQFGGEVARVEPVSGGLPSLPWPLGSMQDWLQLLPSAVAVAVIVFVTAVAVAKSLAGTDRSHLDSNREAVALGLGNVAAALTGGYAIGASLSRSALVEESGGASPMSSAVASAIVLLTLLLLAPILAYLPTTALAALVISAVFGLIKLRDMRNVWNHDRLEGWIIAVCFVATLAFGVRLGLAIGAGVSLAHFLWFSSVPRVTRIGTDDHGVSFRSIDREEVELTLPVLAVRIDRSLYFGNAEFVEEEVFKLLGRHEKVECMVFDMRSVNGVDASGVEMLKRLTQRLHERGVATHFAELHAPVKDSLCSLDATICRYHRTVRQAVEDCGVKVE